MHALIASILCLILPVATTPAVITLIPTTTCTIIHIISVINPILVIALLIIAFILRLLVKILLLWGKAAPSLLFIKRRMVIPLIGVTRLEGSSVLRLVWREFSVHFLHIEG